MVFLELKMSPKNERLASNGSQRMLIGLWSYMAVFLLVFVFLTTILLPSQVAGEIPKGSLHGHLTFDQLNRWMKEQILPKWPNLARLISVGTSVEGRPLYVLCLGQSCSKPDGSQIDESGNHVALLSPGTGDWKYTGQALFTGLHHAREPLGMMAMVAFVDDLLTGYEHGHLDKRHLLRRRQLVFFFVVNPDGYIANEQGNGMRRKNLGKRVEKNCGLSNRGGDSEIGVDLNRNYDFCFNADNIGASTNPCAIDYEGPYPFSEPETIAMKRFVEANNFKVAFNYHSFGKDVYIPYSCKPKGKTKDESFFRTYASRLTKKNGYRYGQPWNEGLYSVNGDAADWMYETKGIFAVSPEVAPADPVKSEHDGFWIDENTVPQLAKETLHMNYVGAWTAGSYVEMKDERIEAVDDSTIEMTFINYGLIPTKGKLFGVVLAGLATMLPLEFSSDSASLLLLPKGKNTFKAMATGLSSPANASMVFVWDALDCLVYTVTSNLTAEPAYRVGLNDGICSQVITSAKEHFPGMAEESDVEPNDESSQSSSDIPPLLVMTFWVVLIALFFILGLAVWKMHHQQRVVQVPIGTSTTRPAGASAAAVYKFHPVAQAEEDIEAYDANLPEEMDESGKV